MIALSYAILALMSLGLPHLLSSQQAINSWNTFSLQILISGDCHPNPGPNYRFPCGICEKPCRSNQRAIACDSCDTWFHAKCLAMPLNIYKVINPNTSWICCTCGLPNFSSTLFDTQSADSINTSIATENTYSILSDAPPTPDHTASSVSHSLSTTTSSFGSPQHTSSPIRPIGSKNKIPELTNFRVLVINFQSLRAKRTSFWLLLEETNPDIIIGSETWLYPGIFEREVLPAIYHTVARRDRVQDRHGGVIIAAKDSITGTVIDLHTETEFAAASFECHGKTPLIIGSLYRPPSSDLTYMEELCSKIKFLHTSYPNSTIWIAGDANLPDIDWKANTVSGHSYPISINKLLLDTIFDTSSEQVVDIPTRGNNILDIFITNRPTLIDRCKVVPGVSDHDIVFVQAQTRATRKKPPRRKILLWKNVDTDSLLTATLDFATDFTSRYTTTTDINTLWQSFRDFTTNVIDKFVPSKMSSTRFNQPWVTRKVKRLSKRKKRAYHKARDSGTEHDINRYKSIRTETRNECRTAYHTYIRDIITTDRNPKKLYSYVKGKRRDNSGVSSLKADGVAHSDPRMKANILNNQFSGVFTTEDTSFIPHIEGTPSPDMHHFSVTVQGVKKLLLDLDTHKAAGPDNIPTRYLKDCADELAPAITLIYQASLQQGEVPSDWREAIVTPIFKKGDHSNPANYRPISLTSVCCKMLEHIIHSQIMGHLDINNILSDQQHGFRKKRSTESQLLLTLQDLTSGLNEGEQIDAVLLDFSKAFDKVPHERLAAKLHHYGIRGDTLRWIKSFLSHRRQQVLVEGSSSTSSQVTSGVPQGSVLGPLLFLLYINDLPAQVTSTSRLFADDSLLYRKVRTTADTKALQDDLDRLQKWEEDWMMSFNPSKCEVIRITKRRNPTQATYNIHGQDLTFTKNGKYLGVYISQNLSWNAHIAATAKKANNSLAFLRRNLTSCPQDIKAQSYQTLVRPILEYASTVWDPYTTTSISQIESVQRRAARFVKGDYKTTSSTSQMIHDLGWKTLQERRINAKLVMVYRIVHGHIDIPASFFRPASLNTRGNSLKFLVPFCRIDIYRHSFFPSGTRLWNGLPERIATADTIEAFRRGLVAAP